MLCNVMITVVCLQSGHVLHHTSNREAEGAGRELKTETSDLGSSETRFCRGVQSEIKYVSLVALFMLLQCTVKHHTDIIMMLCCCELCCVAVLCVVLCCSVVCNVVRCCNVQEPE